MVASASSRSPIARTTIQRYYKCICRMSYAQRLQVAADLVRDPSPLIEQFDASVAAFASYANPEAFYSNPKRAPKPPERCDEIAKTHHVAWHLRNQDVLDVDATPALKARYVDYEVAPTRTTGSAVFEDGGSWRTGLFIDLLLVSCDHGTPIVAELKIRADKDPFTALVQTLACAAHLATPHQYERLHQFAPPGALIERDQPLVDCWVLPYRFLEKLQDDLRRLAEKAVELSALLAKRDEIALRLRRLACIDLDLREDGKLHGTCRWQHDASGSLDRTA